MKKAKELARKMESETKKVKRAEDNRKLFFAEIKKILDTKQDEEPFLPPHIQATVGQIRQAVKDKRIYRFLYSQFASQHFIELRVTK